MSCSGSTPSGIFAICENNGNDVHFEHDFRSVYARVIDNWLGGDSVAVLGGDYRKASLSFIG